MKKISFLLFVLIFSCAAVFATESRIESMGKTDRYLQDEVGMFSNPAYFLIYPNILTGSLGKYDATTWPYTLTQQYFTGWVTIDKFVIGGGFNRHDPMESVLSSHGPISHQIDYGQQMYVLYDTSWVKDTIPGPINPIDDVDSLYIHTNRLWVIDSLQYDTVTVSVPNPVGETDIFLGYNMGNMGIGAHLFLAQQDSLVNGDKIASSGLIKGDLGLVMKLNEKDWRS